MSPLRAPMEYRASEADYARSWYASINRDSFGYIGGFNLLKETGCTALQPR